MAEYLLPPEIKLTSSSVVELTWRDGVMVPSEPIMFPAFSVSSYLIHDFLTSAGEKLKSYSAETLPALPTPQGLVFDTDWAPFGCFRKDGDRFGDAVSSRMLDDIKRGEIKWNVKCPAMNQYESLMGLLIRQYGLFTGGNPDRPGINLNSEHRSHPLRNMFKGATPEEISNFTDRGRTLLDIAMYHHQWDLAEFLWDNGTRWSKSFLDQGRPLESLIITSMGLMGISLQPNDYVSSAATTKEREEWLRKWLDRYLNEGGKVNIAPSLDWRARKAGLRNWEAGKNILDTPASLWISKFASEMRGGLDTDINVHRVAIATQWALFFTGNDVDLEVVEISRGSKNPPVKGFSEFLENHCDSNAKEWIEYIGSITTKARLTKIAQGKMKTHEKTQRPTTPKM